MRKASTVMTRLALFALAAVLLGCTSPPADGQTWLTVDTDGAIQISPGYAAQVDGVGHLRLGEDRARMQVEGPAPMRVLVDGAPIQGRRALLIGSESVEVRAADGTQWTIRRVGEADWTAVLSGSGRTLMRENDPDGESLVESSDPFRFFVRIDADGTSHLVYPL